VPNPPPVEQVDDGRGASCLRISGRCLWPFQKRHENDGGWERETGLRRAVPERVWDTSPGRVATSVRHWCERDGDVGPSR